MLSKPNLTVLGPDPTHRKCRINCYAFQQDAIASFNGWQYAAFYSPLNKDTPEPLYVHLARRRLPEGQWEALVFEDYPQTVDDGHNTIQLGVCPGDGTIHLSYDHHCDVLRYRHSISSLALDPPKFAWSSTLFASIQANLPGLPASHKPFHYVTYPRFLPLDSSLLFTLRDGKAGLGNDHLYVYSPSGQYQYLGQYLTGLNSNPYIHGIDYQNSTLHVTWVYRGFVQYPGWDDLNDTKHKQQAGPNGAENNHDLCYAYSQDQGKTWMNGEGKVIADWERGNTINNDSEGIVALKIGKGRGLTNQESQCVDQDGGVHVLNRDDVGQEEGKVVWKHYYRDPVTRKWSQRPIRAIYGSTRGRLAISKEGYLYIILPDTDRKQIRILKKTKENGYNKDEEVWVGRGLTGEPLIDVRRLEEENFLSLMVLVDGEEGKGRNVAVMDFQL
ncbi:hypothetical protein QBC38DRAFT_200953 [Podospora fimiseda]|uniref:Dockerin type 1 n=1 Tax=Podospora fimiseda TaxID=252190 RepID=A0AAN7BXW5_9PEZI|nr:hypothetical protein QBC38DRAFT_200953 [Podospora fimiseda]